MHKAPRALLAGDAVSEVITGCSRSIIAGRQQSVSWSHGLLFHLAESLGNVEPGCVCNEHADDLFHVVVLKSRMKLCDKSIDIGEATHQGIQELELCLADMFVFMCNDRQLSVSLNRSLQSTKCADTAENVGIEIAAGRCRVARAQDESIRRERCVARQPTTWSGSTTNRTN